MKLQVQGASIVVFSVLALLLSGCGKPESGRGADNSHQPKSAPSPAPRSRTSSSEPFTSPDTNRHHLLDLALEFFDYEKERPLSQMPVIDPVMVKFGPGLWSSVDSIYILVDNLEFEVPPQTASLKISRDAAALVHLTKPVPTVLHPDWKSVTAVKIDGATPGFDAILQSLHVLHPRCLKLTNFTLTAARARAIQALGIRTLILVDGKCEDEEPFPTFAISKLDIATFEMNDKLPQLLDRCPNLRELFIRDQLIDDKSVAAINKHRQLRLLELPATGLTDDQFLILMPGMKLEWLNLHNTGIGDSSMRIIAAQPRLKFLNISRCSVDDEGLCELQNLKSIESIDLSFTDIGDDGVKCLQNLPLLHSIGLSNTKITESCMKYLEVMPALTSVALDEDHLDVKSLRALARARPRLHIR